VAPSLFVACSEGILVFDIRDEFAAAEVGTEGATPTFISLTPPRNESHNVHQALDINVMSGSDDGEWLAVGAACFLFVIHMATFTVRPTTRSPLAS
jgi:hypothetical protein